jgi:hypothetical protein
VRKRWLASVLFARRTAPREAAPFIARQLLTMPDPLRSELPGATAQVLFSEITGRGATGWLEAAGRPDLGPQIWHGPVPFGPRPFYPAACLLTAGAAWERLRLSHPRSCRWPAGRVAALGGGLVTVPGGGGYGLLVVNWPGRPFAWG